MRIVISRLLLVLIIGGPTGLPAQTAPQESAPQESAPQESAPQESAPQESAPQESAPQESTPQESPPKGPLQQTLQQALQLALSRSGSNRSELERALRESSRQKPGDQRAGMEFLIANMPDRDLKSLTAEYLLENSREAHEAWRATPWKNEAPADIFLNDVLPYASINERRDNWRADFRRRFEPLIRESRSPSEAAARLNQGIFQALKVRYSTARKRADQGPFESIETGLASCTGLSILLIDACRSVGVPARFAGTPLWSDGSGNHSWVEVWDGRWHFTGAAEPTGMQLDQAWFVHRAEAAVKDRPLNAIYAVSFRRTPLTFPLVWDRRIDYVHAVNVTDRYAKPDPGRAPPLPEPDLDPDLDLETSSRPPRRARPPRETAASDLRAGPLPLEQLAAHLQRPRSERPAWPQLPFASAPLSRVDAAVAARLLWADHANWIRESRAEEFERRELVVGEFRMPFAYDVVGEAPAAGRSLYLSLHGGGGTAAAINDQQWRNQQRLYKIPEGVYLAPRAPTNSWNLWHQGHIDTLFDRLIEDAIVLLDVDPDRVYLLGYSAGGDGVYQLAPRMADRWAAAAMMAGHPNETSPRGLRNLPFTIHVGAKDAAYRRNEVARQWESQLKELQGADPQGYEHWAPAYPDKGHWLDREDAKAIPWLAKHRRNRLPSRIVWRQDDVRHSRFYWLAASLDDLVRDRAEVIASRAGQAIAIDTADAKRITVRLNDEMLDLDRPMTVTLNGSVVYQGAPQRTIATLARSLAERGDRLGMFSAEVTVSAADSN